MAARPPRGPVPRFSNDSGSACEHVVGGPALPCPASCVVVDSATRFSCPASMAVGRSERGLLDSSRPKLKPGGRFCSWVRSAWNGIVTGIVGRSSRGPEIFRNSKRRGDADMASWRHNQPIVSRQSEKEHGMGDDPTKKQPGPANVSAKRTGGRGTRQVPAPHQGEAERASGMQCQARPCSFGGEGGPARCSKHVGGRAPQAAGRPLEDQD